MEQPAARSAPPAYSPASDATAAFLASSSGTARHLLLALHLAASSSLTAITPKVAPMPSPTIPAPARTQPTVVQGGPSSTFRARGTIGMGRGAGGGTVSTRVVGGSGAGGGAGLG